MGTDAKGWWGCFRMPADEGAVFEAAWNAKREQLYQTRRGEAGDDDVAAVDGVDALLAMAESAMADMEARLPGTERIVVNLHLEANPDDLADGSEAGVLWLHQRGGIDAATRRFLTCDCQLRSVLYRDGVPINAGRVTRNINRALRRSVEHRDRGCATPGCGRTKGLEIHHIRHWEHGGPTDTSNLVALCRRHHHDHHQGRLAITGNPDLAAGHEGALMFSDAHGHTMTPGAHPKTPAPAATPAQAGRAAGLVAPTWKHPLNERLDRRDFHLQHADTMTNRPGHPDPESGSGGAETETDPTDPPPAAATDWDHTGHHPPPGGTSDQRSCTDPTRAGPTDT